METKKCVFTPDELKVLASKVPTPFHLYDEATIRKTCREFNSAFAWADFQNYFAVKATPNPHILKIVKEEGFGADCSSVAELLLADAVGMKGEEIMFTSNNTPLAEYEKAKELGAIINLDDASHLDFLHDTIGLPDFLCFRYNPGPLRTGNVIIGNPADAKFGITTEQLFQCYVKARNYGVKRFGLHTMICSNCLQEEELEETARMVFQLAVDLKKEHNIQVEMVDFGGGIGVAYKPSDKPLDLASLGTKIRHLYKQIIRPAGLDPLKLTFECGRFITGPAGVLVTRVIHQKDIYKRYLGVDACMAHLMRPSLYGSYHHMEIVEDDNLKILEKLPRNRCIFKNDGPTAVFDVVGSLCENNDKLAVDREFPADTRIGDLLVIHDTGAHGHAMGGNYNGKLRTAEYLKVAKGENKGCCKLMSCCKGDDNLVMIRREETLCDLFAGLKWFGSLPGKHLYESEYLRNHLSLIVGVAVGMLSMRYLFKR